jgi:hypothetical protein
MSKRYLKGPRLKVILPKCAIHDKENISILLFGHALYPEDLATKCPLSSRSRVSLAKRKDPWLSPRRC